MGFLTLSNKREGLVRPLLDWKILGVMELKKLSGYHGSYRSLLRMIQRLENDGVLNSFTHAMNNRKFFYVSKEVLSQITEEKQFINEEIKMHDAIVSTIAFKFSELEKTKSVRINAERNVTNSGVFLEGEVEPDAQITYPFSEVCKVMALEVEINRKNSANIFKKFLGYHSTSKIDKAIYFFSSQFHLEAYFNYYLEFRERHSIGLDEVKVFFFCSEKLADYDFDLKYIFWKKPNGGTSTLEDFLNGNK